MGQKDITKKLIEALHTNPTHEADIVFILSRIRKILELENHPEKYSMLNFYCNLALHAKIDKWVPKQLGDELIRVHKEMSLEHPFFGFPKLHESMKTFFKEHNLPSFYDHPNFKMDKFVHLLNEVYSDTPVIVSVITKYKVVVDKNGTITGTIIGNEER